MTYRCNACGYRGTWEEGETLPPCPACQNQDWDKDDGAEPPNWTKAHLAGVGEYGDEAIKRSLTLAVQEGIGRIARLFALSREADCRGNPRDGQLFLRFALDLTRETTRLSFLLGDGCSGDRKDRLDIAIKGQEDAHKEKLAIAQRARELGYDAVYTALTEGAKEEARIGAALWGMGQRED